MLIGPALVSVWVNDSEFIRARAYGGEAQTTFALAILGFALISCGIGYRLGFSVRTKNSPVKQSRSPVQGREEASSIVLACIILIVTGILLRLGYALSVGGYEQALQRMSTGISTNLNLAALPGYIVQMRSISIAADFGALVLLTLYASNRRPSWIVPLVFAIVIMSTFALIGKRLTLLWPLLVVGLIINEQRFRIRNRYIPIILVGIATFGFFSLLFRIYAPAATVNMVIDLREVSWASGSIFLFYFNSEEFSTFEMFTAVIEGQKELTELFGGWWTLFYRSQLEPFLYAIPRLIWASKPMEFRDVAHAVRALTTGHSLETVTGGTASTVLGSSYLLGGPIGLSICLGGVGYFAGRMDKWWRSCTYKTWKNYLIYGFLIATLFHVFRQGSFGWVFIIMILQQMGVVAGATFLIIFTKLSRQRRTRIPTIRGHA